MTWPKNETVPAMNARVFWCLGLYASGSTWLFNVVRQISLSARKGEVETHFLSENADLSALRRPAGFHIVKSHEVSPEAAVSKLSVLMNKCIVTIRDPRDAVCSLMSYQNYEFQLALDQVHKSARICGRLATDQRTLLLTYENRFFDDPATLDMVASHLGIELANDDRDKIFDANQRSAVEKYIGGLNKLPGALQERYTGDWLDPKTHWHTHHSGRTGEVGKWKSILNEEQIKAIYSQLADSFQLK